MKLDNDLIRNILLCIEDHTGDPRGSISIEIPNHSSSEVSYHIQKLEEADFVIATQTSDHSTYQWEPEQLTYEGHQYLETVRDSKIWRLTKQKAQEAGTQSIEMLFQIAKNLVRQEMTKHGIHLP